MSEHDPREDYDEEPPKRRRSPEAVVREPADLMWSLGIFQMGASLLTALVGSSAAVDHLVKGVAMRPEQMETIASLLALSAIGTVIGGVVVRGALNLRKLQRYSRARTAAMLTALSLPFVAAAPFATPVGIWALIVLRRPEVREAFSRTASELDNTPDTDHVST